MPIRNYICKKTGEERFEVYVHNRSPRFPEIRVQRYKKCQTLAEATRWEKVLIRDAATELKTEEDRGSRWELVLQKWETDARALKRNPTTLKPMTEKCIRSTVSTLHLWTHDWLQKPCRELSIKDGKNLLMETTGADLKPATIRKIKTYVNLVFRYGVQEGIIEGSKNSPVHGVPFDLTDGDSLPEILTMDQGKRLLFEARHRAHPWYRVWAVAMMTGMRSSELFALRKENVRLTEGIIRISESWDNVANEAKKTKAKYWRNAPIARNLVPIIDELIAAEPESPFLFPRLAGWEKSRQAEVLREFCEEIGIPSIKFHTLRACFATHLLIMGVDQGTIMAIGGWSNFKTFKIYVRLAGVTERHKTEDLGKALLPASEIVKDRISVLYEPGECSRSA